VMHKLNGCSVTQDTYVGQQRPEPSAADRLHSTTVGPKENTGFMQNSRHFGQPTAREDSSLIIRSGKSSIFSTHPYVGHVYCKLSLLSVLRVNHFVAYLIFCIPALFAVTLWNILCPVITAQRSYASAVLGVVILSDRPSVCPSVGHTRAL